MDKIIDEIMIDLLVWIGWVIIPFIIEIVPSFLGFIILIKKKLIQKKEEAPIKFPEITLIIPVYNSSETLRACLKSVNDSDYDNSLITIYLVNNQSKDDSFEIYCDCQEEFKDLSMQWLNAKQGKSRALNMAIFNSEGKYIINIDSDGKLEKNAIKNIVTRFESDSEKDCLTGVILIEPDLVEKTEGFLLKLLRRCEFVEYGQAFLAGRNVESEMNSIFTVSGAFTAFRKSTLLKTQLYNTDTVCEDAHVTFQIRKLLKKKVNLCENAIFFVDPIDNFNKLYTQRQRWQRGEIEVAHMFIREELNTLTGFLKNFMVRLLMVDHTFAFPRMIWYFAMICLCMFSYPIKTVVGSVAILYFLYIFSTGLYFLNIVAYLEDFKDLRKYYLKKWYIIFLFPFYNFILFWIRLAGIINSIGVKSAWKTRTLNDEFRKIKEIIKSDFRLFSKVRNKILAVINK